MRNEDTWQPSKYMCRRGCLVALRNTREVGIGSRLMVDLIARSYARILPLHARGKLLDLGCGKAPLYGSYKELVSSCVCVDWANTAHKNEHLDQWLTLRFVSSRIGSQVSVATARRVPFGYLLVAQKG